MAGQTPRVKLRLPGRGAGVDSNDPVNIVLDWNNSMDTLDDAVGFPGYTSTTHSLNPFDGKCEYETDTDLLAVWDASTLKWIKYPGDNQSMGLRGSGTVSAASAGFTTASGEQPTGLQASFTCVASRRYWVEWFTYVEQSAGTSPSSSALRLRYAAGASVTTAGTLIGGETVANTTHGVAKEDDFHKIYEVVPNINGQVTIGLFIIVTSAGDTVKINGNASHLQGYMSIKDVGI